MAILLILLDKSLFSVQQSTSVAIIFLLCLHSCIQNSNESNNTNDNHSHLKQIQIENINVNDYQLAQGDLGRLRRQRRSCSLWFYLLSLTLYSANITWHESCIKSELVCSVIQFIIAVND